MRDIVFLLKLWHQLTAVFMAGSMLIFMLEDRDRYSEKIITGAFEVTLGLFR